MDTVIYWRVVNPELAVLAVADYTEAVMGVAQTAMRDIIGRNDLAQVLSDRAGIDISMTETLRSPNRTLGSEGRVCSDARHQNSGCIAGCDEPRCASLTRESQARVVLGESEIKVAQKFADAGRVLWRQPDGASPAWNEICSTK